MSYTNNMWYHVLSTDRYDRIREKNMMSRSLSSSHTWPHTTHISMVLSTISHTSRLRMEHIWVELIYPFILLKRNITRCATNDTIFDEEEIFWRYIWHLCRIDKPFHFWNVYILIVGHKWKYFDEGDIFWDIYDWKLLIL